MTFRTVIHSNYDAYLEHEYPAAEGDSFALALSETSALEANPWFSTLAELKSVLASLPSATLAIGVHTSQTSTMRITSLILPTTLCLAMIGGYAAGYYMGEAEGREAGTGAMFRLDASRSAEAIMLVSTVRQAFRESKPAQAEIAVVRYGALKVPSLVACHSSPDCAASVGQLMPTKAQLEDVLGADRAMRGQRNEPRH